MASEATIRLLQFSLDEQLYALNLDDVERVVRAVELRPLPGSPPVIRGIFSLHGRIVPVADPRYRLGLPRNEIGLEDRIIVAHASSRLLGLLAHGDVEVVACRAIDIVNTESVLAGSDLIDGVGRLPDGLVLIQSLSRFLSLEEERQLERALHVMA
jgi:purine-binding chemotaxis protein CheW